MLQSNRRGFGRLFGAMANQSGSRQRQSSTNLTDKIDDTVYHAIESVHHAFESCVVSDAFSAMYLSGGLRGGLRSDDVHHEDLVIIGEIWLSSASIYFTSSSFWVSSCR